MRRFALLLGFVTFSGLQAQEPTPAPEARNYAYSTRRVRDDGNRAALGVSTMSSGKRDSLGLLVTNVTPNSPAEKSGIVEGDRLVSIDGTSLKLAPSDAGERDMNGVMTRRLTRSMGELRPGDEVSLVVYSNGSQKTVKVKTTAASDLDNDRETSRADRENRPAIGIAFGGGSPRDSLGLFVTSVTPAGPAEKAGIEEGDRIAAINGTDVRVPAAEAGEGALVWGKESRLRRVLNGVKAGDAVELRVYANGTYKNVKVTTVKASTLFKDQWGMMGDGMNFMYGEGPMINIAPMPPMPPMAPMKIRVGPPQPMDGSTMSCETTPQGNVECSNDARDKMSRAMRDADHAMRDAARSANYAYSYSPGFGRGSGSGSGSGEMNFDGLRMSPVSPGLASYFGAGSEKGLVVLAASDQWQPLAAGDVVLTVNGKPVSRSEGGKYISIDTDRDNTFGILRKGKKMSLIVKAQ
jgi:S1-C subfamily serine protease